MAEVNIRYPFGARQRGLGFWLRFRNLWASRRVIFRRDNSKNWRYSIHGSNADPIDRSVAFHTLLGRLLGNGFRFIILGNTGEGDRSQYALLPIIRALRPDFMIINGGIAYPTSRKEDIVHCLFKPYQGLGIPIWTVPGEEVYGSKTSVRDYFEVFCSNEFLDEWREHGLRFVKQPGTYWELKDIWGDTDLVILGLDTGLAGDLDGATERRQDFEQHIWLEGRLQLAQSLNKKVVVLFHIPALTAQGLNRKAHLFTLHNIIAKYSCVRLVIGAHEHNYQQYSPETFRRFLSDITFSRVNSTMSPHYIISGGGARLSNTYFRKNDYPVEVRYPSVAQWNGGANLGMRIIDKIGLSETLAGDIVRHMKEDIRSDFDHAGLLSCLLVEVKGRAVKVCPVFLDDVRLLFSHLPPGSIVDIQDENPPVYNMAVERCIQEPILI